jgi:hypothetical protein
MPSPFRFIEPVRRVYVSEMTGGWTGLKGRHAALIVSSDVPRKPDDVGAVSTN